MRVLAIYGSPRRQGNTALLLKKAVEGARAAGCAVDEVVLRDLRMSPCLELYGCKKDGRCIIRDDFQQVYEQLDTCDGIMLASPIFFYSVSAQTKILIDRCQSFWVRKHWVAGGSAKAGKVGKKGLFIGVGATSGKKLFDGALLTVRYFFEAIDAELWASLLCRGIDFEGDIMKNPAYLEQAFALGSNLSRALQQR